MLKPTYKHSKMFTKYERLYLDNPKNIDRTCRANCNKAIFNKMVKLSKYDFFYYFFRSCNHLPAKLKQNLEQQFKSVISKEEFREFIRLTFPRSTERKLLLKSVIELTPPNEVDKIINERNKRLKQKKRLQKINENIPSFKDQYINKLLETERLKKFALKDFNYIDIVRIIYK